MQKILRLYCIYVHKVIAAIKNAERIIFKSLFQVKQSAQHLRISSVTLAEYFSMKE